MSPPLVQRRLAGWYTHVLLFATVFAEGDLMKIVIPGGSGQIGTLLCRAFVADGHNVVVLCRNPRAAPWKMVPWNGQVMAEWAAELDGADVVINLAGRSVNCRYHAANRAAIMNSRVQSTRAVGRAIAQARRPPAMWLQAGTATIYAHRYDAPNDEATGMLGSSEPDVPSQWKFSIDVAQAWEQAAQEAGSRDTRLVILRSAMTMSPDPGGIFDVMSKLVRRGLGGTAGDGRQYVSWIHEQDFIAAVYWLIHHPQIAGAVNVAAPNPLPNAEFMRILRQAWGVRIGPPAPAWLLEIGAFFMRTETELLLKSRRVVPGRLLQSGFAFSFPDWPQAAEDLCRRWRENKRLV